VHVLQALVYLVVASILGLVLAVSGPSDASLRMAFAYGVCGLLGFLCQLVLGIESRLVPLSAWLQAFAGGGYQALPSSLHTAMPRRGAAGAVALWSVGVPCLAAGLAFDRAGWVSVGAGALALGVLLAAGSAIRALHRLRAA
jgi:hypothetical protein